MTPVAAGGRVGTGREPGGFGFRCAAGIVAAIIGGLAGSSDLLATPALDLNGVPRAAMPAAAHQGLRPPQVREAFDRTIAQGLAAIEEGEPARAIPLLRQALQLSPDHPVALALLGSALLESGDTAGAIVPLERATALAPDYYPGQLWLAQAYAAANRLSDAAAAYGRCIDLDPDEPSARARLAALLLRMGRLEEAVMHARSLVSTSPDNYTACYLLATIELESGHSEIALVMFEAAEHARPGDVRALYGQALALAGLGRASKALGVLGRLVETDADNPDVWALFADVLLSARGDPDARLTAADFYQEALRLRPGIVATVMSLARLYLQLGLHPEAADLILALGDAADDNPGVAALLGRALAKQHKYSGAVTAYRQSIASGGGATVWYDLGVALVNLSRLADAADAFRHATRQDDLYAEAFRDLGKVLLERNEIDSARASLAIAIGLAPEDGQAHYLAGMAALKAMDFDTAVSELESAHELNPKDASALYNLANAVRRQGNLQRNEELLAALRDLRRQQQPESAAEVRRNKARILLRGGQVRYRLGSNERAARAFTQVIEIDPGNDTALLYLGMTRARLQEWEAALAAVEKAAAIDSGRAETFVTLALIYTQLGRPDDAARAELRAKALASSDPS